MEGHATLLNGMTRAHPQYCNLLRMGIDRQPMPMLIISSYIGRVLFCHSSIAKLSLAGAHPFNLLPRSHTYFCNSNEPTTCYF